MVGVTTVTTVAVAGISSGGAAAQELHTKLHMDVTHTHTHAR